MILRLVVPLFSSQYFPLPPFRLISQDLLGGKYSLICHFLLSFFILLFSFVRDLIIAEFCAFSCHLNQNSKCVKLNDVIFPLRTGSQGQGQSGRSGVPEVRVW